MESEGPAQTGAPTVRPAVRGDAADLARLEDLSSEGRLRVMWSTEAPERDALEVGADRAARDGGRSSWRNAFLAEIDGAPAGAAYTTWVAHSQMVQSLATYPEFRRRGVARLLLLEVERVARSTGKHELRVMLIDPTASLIAFYQRVGFVEQSRARPRKKHVGQIGPGGLSDFEVVCMARPVA